jgi:hypothetical protein
MNPDPALAHLPTPERLVELLSERQHLHPHHSVASALEKLIGQLGICPDAVRRASHSLVINSGQAIGRLRRTELIQLARTIHRIWRQNVAAGSAPSQSA